MIKRHLRHRAFLRPLYVGRMMWLLSAATQVSVTLDSREFDLAALSREEKKIKSEKKTWTIFTGAMNADAIAIATSIAPHSVGETRRLNEIRVRCQATISNVEWLIIVWKEKEYRMLNKFCEENIIFRRLATTMDCTYKFYNSGH